MLHNPGIRSLAWSYKSQELKCRYPNKGPAWNPADAEGKAKSNMYNVDWSSYRRRR